MLCLQIISKSFGNRSLHLTRHTGQTIMKVVWLCLQIIFQNCPTFCWLMKNISYSHCEYCYMSHILTFCVFCRVIYHACMQRRTDQKKSLKAKWQVKEKGGRGGQVIEGIQKPNPWWGTSKGGNWSVTSYLVFVCEIVAYRLLHSWCFNDKATLW